MSFSSGGEKIWPVPPDWRNGVQETLAWNTDILSASATALTQHRALRQVPRRSFSFDVIAAGQERRVADMLLAGHMGPWYLPIWPDVQWMETPMVVGAVEIPCRTVGFDFSVNGKALIYLGLNHWEVVDVEGIDADRIHLASPLGASYAKAARLYPLRRARVQDEAEERLLNDNASRRRIVFDIDEACEWPALIATSQYLTHPVLDKRPDEGDNPVASYTRSLIVVDDETGLPFVQNLPNLALRTQQSHWILHGRGEHAWFRSLAYLLSGRSTPIWIPSFASDLVLAAPVGGDSTVLRVEWAAYSLFGMGKHNRKDLRIELVDGSVLYRRIVAATSVGFAEDLTLNAALSPASVGPSSIRSISFMALCTSASDTIEIEHLTDQDGTATVSTGWQAVVPDV